MARESPGTRCLAADVGGSRTPDTRGTGDRRAHRDQIGPHTDTLIDWLGYWSSAPLRPHLRAEDPIVRVLLLGAGGLVGRHLRAALVSHDVVATTRDGAEDAIALDIRDTARLREIAGAARPDAILNAAAAVYAERCEREPVATRAINVEPVRALAEIADQQRATLVVLSSEYVFDGTHGLYTEEDAPTPVNEYGRQKVEIEALARTVGKHLVIRTSGVYGAEPARKNFVWQVVDALRRGDVFRVPSDQLITPTYAPSLAAGIVELLSDAATGTFHVVGPEVIGRDAFARLIATTFQLDRALIRPVKTSELALAAPRPPRAGLSDAKFRSARGHRTTPPAEGLLELAASLGAAIAS